MDSSPEKPMPTNTFRGESSLDDIESLLVLLPLLDESRHDQAQPVKVLVRIPGHLRQDRVFHTA